MEKKFAGNCTKMLWATLNKSWKQHPTKQQLYGQLPTIYKSIQVRRTRHTGHCWRSKGKLISDVLQWTPSQERAGVRRTARTYLQQLCTDTVSSLEDLQEAIDDRDEWRGRVREIRARGTWWWWWCWHGMKYYHSIRIYLTSRWKPNGNYYSGSERKRKWRGHSRLPTGSSLILYFFRRVWRVLPLCRGYSRCILSPLDRGFIFVKVYDSSYISIVFFQDMLLLIYIYIYM